MRCLSPCASPYEISPHRSRPSQRRSRPIIIWDTETTGLSQKHHRMLEIAFMELPYLQNFENPSTFSSLVKPPNISDPGNSFHRLSGLKSTMFRTARPFSEVWSDIDEFVDEIKNDRGRPIMVAHNMSFDLRFLRAELNRIGKVLPDWDFSCSLRDVCEIVWPGQPASLASLTKRLHIVNTAPHRALPDVKATVQVLLLADEELRNRTQPLRSHVLPHGSYVRQLLEEASKRRRENPDGSFNLPKVRRSGGKVPIGSISKTQTKNNFSKDVDK